MYASGKASGILLRFGCLMALTLVSACSKAPDDDEIAKNIQHAMDATVAALNARDAETAVEIDAPDYVGINNGIANLQGKAADLNFTRNMVADHALKLAIKDSKVDVAKQGDMAVFSTTYVLTSTDPVTRKPGTSYGNWVVVFRKQADNSLRAALGVVSQTPAPAAAK